MHNRGALAGGGIYFGASTTVVLVRCRIELNACTNSGCGLYLGASTSAEVTACDVRSNGGGLDGGGFWVGASVTLVLTRSVVSQNYCSRYGAGFYLHITVHVTFLYCTVSYNIGATHGGGMYFIGSQSSTSVGNFVVGFTDCAIQGNGASVQGGGGWFGTDGAISLAGSRFKDNFISGVDGAGAGLYVGSEVSTTISGHCSFTGNHGAAHGGGIYFAPGYYSVPSGRTVVSVTNTVFGDNSASLWGGAVFVGVNVYITLTFVVFWGNGAGAFGGGLYLASTGTVASCSSCTWRGNWARSGGGGLYLSSGGGSLTLTAYQFLNNSAGEPRDFESQLGDLFVGSGSTLPLQTGCPTGELNYGSGASLKCTGCGDDALPSNLTLSLCRAQAASGSVGSGPDLQRALQSDRTLNLYQDVYLKHSRSEVLMIGSSSLKTLVNVVVDGLGLWRFHGQGMSKCFYVGNPGTSVTFRDLTVCHCRAWELSHGGANGGAVHAGPGAIVTLTRVVLEYNVAERPSGSGSSGYGGGGGFFLGAGATLTALYTELRHNRASGGGLGGGLFLDAASTATLERSWLAHNAGARRGGGLFLGLGAAAEMVSCRIVGNAANHTGGGVHISGGGAELYTLNTHMLDNAAHGNGKGGAVFVTDGGELVTFGHIVMNNSAGIGLDVFAVPGSTISVHSKCASGSFSDGSGILQCEGCTVSPLPNNITGDCQICPEGEYSCCGEFVCGDTDLYNLGLCSPRSYEVCPVPTPVPSPVPSPVPTSLPTLVPTLLPTTLPSGAPTPLPTIVPTSVPTIAPTPLPTPVPSPVPTISPLPSPLPSPVPTPVPSPVPTQVPTTLDLTVIISASSGAFVVLICFMIAAYQYVPSPTSVEHAITSKHLSNAAFTVSCCNPYQKRHHVRTCNCLLLCLWVCFNRQILDDARCGHGGDAQAVRFLEGNACAVHSPAQRPSAGKQTLCHGQRSRECLQRRPDLGHGRKTRRRDIVMLFWLRRRQRRRRLPRWWQRGQRRRLLVTYLLRRRWWRKCRSWRRRRLFRCLWPWPRRWQRLLWRRWRWFRVKWRRRWLQRRYLPLAHDLLVLLLLPCVCSSGGEGDGRNVAEDRGRLLLLLPLFPLLPREAQW